MPDTREEHFYGPLYPQWSTNKACLTCIHAFGKPPFEDTPMKASCIKYPKPRMKPKGVLIDGEPCEFYERHPDPPDFFIIASVREQLRAEGLLDPNKSYKLPFTK